jgi:iron(II)-dependent oxidoreductase
MARILQSKQASKFSDLLTSFFALLLFVSLSACGGSGGGSCPFTDTTTSGGSPSLGAVTGLTVTPGDGQNTLTWDAVAGAASYFLYYGDSSAERAVVRVADCGASRIEGITGASYTHTGLTNGVSYTYNVTALGADGVEGTCGENVTPVTGTPEAPKVYGCNHPDATNYDPTVTDYVPGSCWWPTPAPAGLSCATGMVKFTGGTFTMGDDTDANGNNPEHTVTLSDFCIDAKEVTQAQHQAWHAGVNDTTWVAYGYDADALCGGSRTTCPAEQVDRTNAQAYCQAQGKRLPREAEWEYAARNGGTAAVNAYATGSVAAPVACTDANFSNCNGGGATSAVGSYAASASGLFDMAGNVWEWTGDWYDAAYYADGQVDPTGPGAGANGVVRGGSWNLGVGLLRASLRSFNLPTDRNFNLGFRCASN